MGNFSPPPPSTSTILDGIPTATEKTFPSNRALGIITADPAAIANGKDTYKKRSADGEVTLYKQKIVNMDSEALSKAVKLLERGWDLDTRQFRSFKMFVASKDNHWSYDDNVIEELEQTNNGTQFMFFRVIRNASGKFSLAICHLKSDQPLQNDVLIGGLIMEGLLGKDEEKKIYLQF